MTDKQKYLLNQMYNTISELAEECEQDDDFHEIMIENNKLFPMSLDEWSYEWLNIVEREDKYMKTTQEFFSHLTEDELLENDEIGLTKEENLLFNLGGHCDFFDDREEYEVESERGYKEWLSDKGFNVTHELETINGRLAVISD